MVVCKFYLQGTCKFGNSCRYEHDASGGQSHGSSILRQQQAQVQPQMDQNALVQSVVTDSLAAEHGKQWMLSCYAPFKDKRPFPGFEDRSFEEVRYGFKEATNNGNVEQFKQEFNASYQDAMNRVKMLQHPSPNVADLITQVYGAPTKNPDGHVEQVSRSILSSGGFGQNNTAPSIFGGGQNSGSVFGGNKSVFGQTPTGNSGGSIFGQTPTANSGGSVFGQNPTSGSVFGQNAGGAATNPIFAQGNANSPFGQSVFGQTPNVAQNSNSIFGQNPSLNAGQNPTSVFGQNPGSNTGQNSIFGQNTNPGQNSIFGQNPSSNPGQNSIFGQNPSSSPGQTSIFGQNPGLNPAQNSGSIFGQNVNNQPVFGQNNPGNSGIFGQNPTNPAPIFGNPNPNASSSIFGQKPPENTATQPSVFGNVFTQNKPVEQPNQQNQSPFGNPPVVLNIPSPFGQSPNAQQPSIFGGPQGHSASIFGQRVGQNVPASEQAVPEMLEKLYSKLAELGEDDVKCFEAAMFEFGKIPEVPPPYEVCF